MIQLHKGDCLEVMKDIADGSVDAIITDPPYGTTQCKWDSVIPFEPMWEQLHRIIKPNGAIVLFGSEPFSSALRMSNIKNYKYDWIWVKNLKTDFLNARKKPMRGHEIISVFAEKLGGTYNPQKRKRTTETKAGNKLNGRTKLYGNQKKVWIDRQDDYINPDSVLNGLKCVHNSQNKQHPTQKPIELMQYLVKTYTNQDEVVLDFTMGSGSTGVACVNTKRSFIGIEQDDNYFTIAQERIDNAQRQSLIDFPTQ